MTKVKGVSSARVIDDLNDFAGNNVSLQQKWVEEINNGLREVTENYSIRKVIYPDDLPKG